MKDALEELKEFHYGALKEINAQKREVGNLVRQCSQILHNFQMALDRKVNPVEKAAVEVKETMKEMRSLLTDFKRVTGFSFNKFALLQSMESLKEFKDNMKAFNIYLRAKLKEDMPVPAIDLSTPWHQVDCSVRLANCLNSAGIYTIGDLFNVEECDLFKVRNFGKKSLMELRRFLVDHNLNWEKEKENKCKK